MSDDSVRVDFQVVFVRLPNTPGGSGPNGMPRVNDLIQDPLSDTRAPVLAFAPPLPSIGHAYTLLGVHSLDYSTVFGSFGYNLFDLQSLRVIETGADYIVCTPAVPLIVTFPATGRHVASLYMWGRDEASLLGEDGLFNRPVTLATVETTIDLAAPGAHGPQNSVPLFSQSLPSILEFSASQILNDANGDLVPGAQLQPPPSSPLLITDADVIAGDPNSDILTFEITNPPDDAVPGWQSTMRET